MNNVTNITDSKLHKLLEENKQLKTMLRNAASELKYIHDVYMAGDTDYLNNGNLYNPEAQQELVAKTYSWINHTYN